MDPALRVVTTMPLDELFDERGPVPATRTRPLGANAVRDHLRSGSARVAVARMGERLAWLPPCAETFAFWREEVRPRLWGSSVERLALDEFQGERAWSASEWRSSDGSVVVLFEQYH